MSSQLAHDLNDNKWRSDDITVTGDEESEVTFSSLNLSPNVGSGLRANGFVRLSAIQLHAIPLGRCGVDLILQSKSGTGKTCVFVVIALELLEAFQSTAIQVIVVCPTREIAVQTNQVINSLATHSPHVRSCPVIGGTKLKDDVNVLSGCQAVVGTPGRIKQLIELNVLKTNSIRLLVLDECDKLLDNNFRQQIDDIFGSLPQNKQTIAVSATMTSELAHFLTQYMRTPVFVRLNADNPALIGVKQLYTITEYHHLNHINFDNKIEPLIEILANVSFSQCLVFSNYQTRARMLCDKLNALNWKTTYISAEKCQSERLKAISKLRKYKCRVLVSTDLTARGIDVQNVNLVINMDTPFDAQTYLHRIGRAGRFGTRGIAITIASNGREAELLHNIIKDCKLNVEKLKHPIPEDIWKMDDSDEDFALIEKAVNLEKVNQDLPEDYEEYNPLERYSVKTVTNPENTLTQIKSFGDIFEEYNLLLKNLVENKDNTNSDGLEENGKYLCEAKEEVCDDLLNGHEIGLNFNVNKDTQELQALSCDKLKPQNNSKQFAQSFDDEISCDLIDPMEPSLNVIQSGRNEWSKALFPPFHTIDNPFQYNQWIETNHYLWSYMLNPFSIHSKVHSKPI